MLKKPKQKTDWKRVFRFAAWSLVIAGFLVTVGFTESKQRNMPCSEVNVTIKGLSEQTFVEKSDVMQTVQDKFGQLTGKPLNTINISLLENIIDNNPFVASAEVFSTIDGKLNIEVVPRVPIVRIIDNNNQSFYIDDRGVCMPLSDKYSASVPVVSGFIQSMEGVHKVRMMGEKEISDTSFHPTMIEKVYSLAGYISRHEFWNAQVEQVYVDEDGEMELIPRVGNQTIVFGDEKQMDEKFKKLFLFYKEGLSKQGWDKYKTINLKYKDQVVCTKK